MKQSEAIEVLKSGKNVFLTGQAGSGKTYLLNKYIDYLKENGVFPSITASTGIAATHISGITIHSWCGMGIEREIDLNGMRKLLKKKVLRERIRRAKVLIIDEISMLDADRLELVSDICGFIRNSVAPFGGMQVIFCGDFFQLPPVDKDNEYAYRARVWNNMDLKICYLEEQYRQKDDKFTRILNNIRENKVKRDDLLELKKRIGGLKTESSKATKLFTINKDVDVINSYELIKIQQEEVEYKMKMSHEKGRKHSLQFLVKNGMANERLILKVGARVMFIKNKFNEEGGVEYVNGTLGVVVGFTVNSKFPIVQTKTGDRIIPKYEDWIVEEDGVVVAKISQIPLRLAWAITVHKSQGMSLDEVELDLGNAFNYGMGYVALSRVRSLCGAKILGLNKMALQVCPKILIKDKVFREDSMEVKKEMKKIGKRKTKEIQEKFLEELKQFNRTTLLG